MGAAWPRFLPRSTSETMAHALIIEASVIVAAGLGKRYADLYKAHSRAEEFARAHYSADSIERAVDACAAVPGNENPLLHRIMRFPPTDLEARTGPPLVVAASINDGPALRRPAASSARNAAPNAPPANNRRPSLSPAFYL